MKKAPVFRTEIARIYTLSDFEGKVFYVGCTIQPLFVRLKMHLCEARFSHPFTNKAKNKIIKSLDFKVLITEVDRIEVSGYKGFQMTGKARGLELNWVEKYQQMGFQLTNKKELRFLERRKVSDANHS